MWIQSWNAKHSTFTQITEAPFEEDSFKVHSGRKIPTVTQRTNIQHFIWKAAIPWINLKVEIGCENSFGSFSLQLFRPSHRTNQNTRQERFGISIHVLFKTIHSFLPFSLPTVLKTLLSYLNWDKTELEHFTAKLSERTVNHDRK